MDSMLKNATTLPFLSGLALLASSGVTQAQDDAQVAPTIPQPSARVNEEVAQLSPLVADPQLLQATLPNGVRYQIRPTAEPKGRASVRLYVEAGSLDEKEETKGLSHFLEHLVFNGSRHFERGELIPKMQKLGIGFGGDSNAYTSLRQTVYMMDLPNLEEETVDFVMTVIRDFADGATLTDEAIDKERGIIISELKARDSASYRARLQMLEQVTAGTRVVPYMPIGLESVILGAPYETFRTLYRERYTADRVTVMITGDVATEEAEAWVKKYFEDMPATKGAPRIAPGVPNTEASVAIIPNAESALTALSITMVKPFELKEDTIEKRVADFPLQLACKMLNNRLSRLARQEGTPFVSAQVGQDDVIETSTIFTLNCSAKPENYAAALALVEQELRRACRYGFQEAEYKEAIDGLGVSFQTAIDTWPSTSATEMAKYLIEAKDDKMVMTDPREDMRAFIEGVKFVMSRPELCQERLAAEYQPDKAMLTVMGAIPDGLDAARLSALYQESLAQEVEPPAKIEMAEFAYQEIGPAGKVTQQTHLEDLDVTTITLSNGVRVNLKPVDFKKGSISVSAQVDGGSLSLPTQLGLKNFAGATMTQGGLEAHSFEELKRIFAAHQVGMTFGVTSDRFDFSGKTNMADLELQCKLLAAMILHPGYREEAARMYRQVIPTIFQRMSTTPEGVFSLMGPRKFYGDDIRLVLPMQEELEACTMADVKAALSPFLKDGAMEVTIVGDFKVEDVLPILERSFGAMPERKAEFTPLSEAQRTVSLAPNGWGNRDFVSIDSEVDKTLVVQYVAAGDGRDKKRNRRIKVLSGMVREKLFDGLRAALGEAYSPSVKVEENTPFNDAALLLCLSSGVIDNREKVSAAMDCILTQIGQGCLTQEDFDRAIGPLLTMLDKQLRDSEFWAKSISRIQSDTDSLELLRSIKDDYASITYEEVNAIAKEIYGGDQRNYLFIMPQKAVPPTPDSSTEQVEEQLIEQEHYSMITNPLIKAAQDTYAVVISEATHADPAWRSVALALMAKYPNSKLTIVPKLEECADALRACEARYAGIVAQPSEIDYQVVNAIHRATRQVDDDPWGDCIWGFITGHQVSDALRIVKATAPQVLKRSLATTNVNPARFEYSYTITDWAPCEIMTQKGYRDAPKQTVKDARTLADGMQHLFAKNLATQKPDLVTTSAHATEFNLEMPFGEGLIYSYGNRFYELKKDEMARLGDVLTQAREGDETKLAQLAAENPDRIIKPDGQSRVWIAAGNCLFGHANRSTNSMAVTAASAYGCNQIVGYTVPSWYGVGGWGTINSFFSSYEGIPLAHAWYLNNQFILKKGMDIHPKLMDAEFNDAEIKKGESIAQSLLAAGVPANQISSDAIGVVHDRDVVAFYGDPMWVARLDANHAPTGLALMKSKDASTINLKATADFEGRFAYWFPKRGNFTTCDVDGAVVTNDFILLPSLKLKKGENLNIKLK